MDSTQRKTFFIITIALIMITLQQVASCPPTPTKSNNNEAEKQQLKINEHKQQAAGQENAASTNIKQLIRHQRSIQPQLEQQLQLDDAQALKRQLPVSETNTTSTFYVQLLFPLSHSHPAS